MKNQELNLVELLKDCPKGTKFYSPICGEVGFIEINKYANHSVRLIDSNGIFHVFTTTGCYDTHKDAECLLFPSKDQRDWNVWKEEQDKKKQTCKYNVGDYFLDKENDVVVITEIIDSDNCRAKLLEGNGDFAYRLNNLKNKIDKYPIEHFQPFDKVLVRDANTGTWMPDFYGSECDGYYGCVGGVSTQCIPYNEETKHLLGTTEKAPEFYINWQEE